MEYDVVAVNIETHTVQLMATGKTLKSAKGVERMAIMRRGVDEEFFAVVLSGRYKEGDEWSGGAK